MLLADSLIHVFPAVSEICLFDVEAAVECVDFWVCSTALSETSARMQQWKHRLVADPGKQLGWIQCKADAEFFKGNLMLPHLQPLLVQRTLPPSLRGLNVSG